MPTKTDLERAYEALAGKQARYTKLFNYYDGAQPLTYSVERLRQVFKHTSTSFTQNWCAVVVNSPLERLHLERFAVAHDEAAEQTLAALFEETELLLDADDVHKAALICGEAFVIVWPGAEGRVEAYYNDPRLVHVFYDEENPRAKSFAAKWWRESSGYWRLTLYYPDRLEYYRTRRAVKEGSPGSAKEFVSLEDGDGAAAANPFGQVPVFHFRPDRRQVKSVLTDVVDLQNAINKLFSDMMVAAEFGAFRQRWVIANGDIDQLKNAPNEIWELPAGDGIGQVTTVGEFGETNLKNYLDAMDNLAGAIAVVTGTPRHFFFGQGGTPSGEALIALEAPLNKKTQRMVDLFAVTWRKVAAFMLEASGASIDAGAITAVFETPHTVQPRTQAEIRQINTTAGIPVRTTLKREGWTEGEIEEMEADLRAEQAARQLSFADLLVEGERRFNAGPNGGEGS